MMEQPSENDHKPASPTNEPVSLAEALEENKALQKELGTAKSKLEMQRETIKMIATFALVLAVPGPLLILLAHVPLGVDGWNVLLFISGLRTGIVGIGLAMLLGLYTIYRWQGIVACGISTLWWIWFVMFHPKWHRC